MSDRIPPRHPMRRRGGQREAPKEEPIGFRDAVEKAIGGKLDFSVDDVLFTFASLGMLDAEERPDQDKMAEELMRSLARALAAVATDPGRAVWLRGVLESHRVWKAEVDGDGA